MELTPAIGLEVHASLGTKTKAFCSCPVEPLAAPNTMVCPICLGLPGTLPSPNQAMVEFGLRAALALECTPQLPIRFDRKCYFSADLPKGYQLTQHEHPLALGGHLQVRKDDGATFEVQLLHVHLEEDAARVLLLEDGLTAGLDFNRCGCPLLEVVTAPTLHSPQEVVWTVRELRALLRCLGCGDFAQELGQLRCDVSISLSPPDRPAARAQVELKNLNSLSGLGRAVAFELDRLSYLHEAGQELGAETRRWDAARGETVFLRRKESTLDYRFVRDPDLPAFPVSSALLETLAASLPELPTTKAQRLAEHYELAPRTLLGLVEEPSLARWLEDVLPLASTPARVIDLLRSVLPLLADRAPRALAPSDLATLSDLVETRRLEVSLGRDLLARALREQQKLAVGLAEALAQPLGTAEELRTLVRTVLDEHGDVVERVKTGKTGGLEYLVGEVLRRASSRLDPRQIKHELEHFLEHEA